MSKHRDEQALHAVEKANNAVGQMNDHPSERMEHQAENAVIHAQIAVGQAQQDGSDSAALNQAASDLRSDLQAVEHDQNNK
jgi:hypothetical protein